MKNNFILFLLLIITGLSEKGYSQSTSPQKGHIQKGYKDWYVGDFRCGVYVPPSYNPSKKYPLVIYLHGKGDTLTRNLGWYHHPAVVADPCIVLTPKCPRTEEGEWGNSESAQIPPMVTKTFEMIELVKKQYNLDEDRLYIYGISMGAIGTFGIIQKYPHMFAAGYAVCGWGDPRIAPQLSNIPFQIFHGERDDIVPVEGSRRVYRAVVAYGGKQIRYTEFKNVKHDAHNYLPANIYTWLLKQKKGSKHSTPDEVPNFRVTAENGHNKSLSWDKPENTSDPDKEIWYYKIYKNGSLIREVDSEHATGIELPRNVKSGDEYTIRSVNYYFKESGISGPIRIETAAK